MTYVSKNKQKKIKYTFRWIETKPQLIRIYGIQQKDVYKGHV